jgi:adenylate cyclase
MTRQTVREVDQAEGPGAQTDAEKAAAAEKALDSANAKLKQSELLLAISRRVAAMETVDEILETLVEITTVELGAERGSLFLNDATTNELFSRVATGMHRREIRVMNNAGIVGHVFQTGQGLIVDDAYSDERFDGTIDKKTGFKTRSILCAPVKTVKGEVIGCTQVLNKKQGRFTEDDLSLLEAMTGQAAVALQSTQFVERMKKVRAEEMEFLDMVADITSEIKLDSLLKRVMSEATRILKADRSTLFLNDEKTDELWSQVGEGLDAIEIRLPNHLGIAGTVFQSGTSINIPHAYADLRFNPAFDKKTGYFTRSILCVPVVNKQGKVIGVTQALNKKGGPFTGEDEQRLKAFTAQISIALENAKLFADVHKMKNYNESMLQSMSNGVVTLDGEMNVVTCNAAGERILQTKAKTLIGKPAADFFTGKNGWVMERLARVDETGEAESALDAELAIGKERVSVNLTAQPLKDEDGQSLGVMLLLEDISSEKRMKSTMSRYMDPGLADKLMGEGSDILGGQAVEATVLFSDVRSFTTITEQLGAQGTVKLLNEYFTIMVDCLSDEGGMLDKFIGDAMMAGFGVPVPGEDDADRAVRCSIKMLQELKAWNAKRAKRDQPPVEIGIGLNTDTVVSGNIGSQKRMDFTMIGDGVNLAARLESACKQYAAKLLISEFTYRKLKGVYRMREVDRVIVKGKTAPVGVYEVLDFYDSDEFPEVMEVLGHFKSGVESYRKGDWQKAIGAFREAERINPNDRLSRIYVERCEHLVANPPDDWQGVWVMTSK